MRLAKIMENDVVDCDNGFCVSVWVSGCPHHCVGCHNQDLWDRNYGEERPWMEVAAMAERALKKNRIERNLSILGGEPLADYNYLEVGYLINYIKKHYQKTKIYLWTGYTLEELPQEKKEILKNVDVLIDGRFELDKRDITLKLRGSSNQRILYKGKDF